MPEPYKSGIGPRPPYKNPNEPVLGPPDNPNPNVVFDNPPWIDPITHADLRAEPKKEKTQLIEVGEGPEEIIEETDSYILLKMDFSTAMQKIYRRLRRS